MPMVWDQAADAQLFAGILTTHDISIDYKKLAEFMGNGCTPKAVTHRVAKIRALAKNTLRPENDAEANTTTPSTAGKKRGRPSNEDVQATPTKQARTPAKAKAKAKANAPVVVESEVKEEDDEENVTSED